MGRLEAIEKRIVSKASVMHPIAAIHMDDAAWLIARLKEARAALLLLQDGMDEYWESDNDGQHAMKATSDFLAKLEASDEQA